MTAVRLPDRSRSLHMSHTESTARGLIFLACVVGGLLLMIPAAWLGHLLLSRVDLAPWLESLAGLGIALFPVILLARIAVKHLNTRFPDSPPGRIPEPHERRSAHKQTRF